MAQVVAEKVPDVDKETVKFNKEVNDLSDKFLDIATYFQRMTPLFEEEPLFKSFLIVREVGAISLSDLKNALGIPTITLQKYVQKFVDNNIFKYNDAGDISLNKDFLE